jgi:hypothetical protein
MLYELLTCFTTGIYFDKGGGDTPWGKKFAFDRAEVQEYFFIGFSPIFSAFDTAVHFFCFHLQLDGAQVQENLVDACRSLLREFRCDALADMLYYLLLTCFTTGILD